MKKRINILLIILSISLVLSSCGKNNDADLANGDKNEDKRVESIKLAGGTDWGMSNPFLQDPRGPGTGKVKLIFDSLLDADEEGIIPWLAEEWSIEDNIYSFRISEDASFHDGEKLTTKDVGFSIDYYKEYPPINNVLGYEEDNIIEKYNIIDDQNIEIQVKKPFANTLNQLGSFLIIPKHIWEDIEDPYIYTEEDAFIGSGPYTWGEYNAANGSYEFIANDNYYGRKPAADRVLFVPVSDNILAFENKEIDITDVPVDLIEKYKNNDDIQMIEKENDMGYKLLMNMELNKELQDVDMRKALYKSIDRDSIVDKVFRGLGDVGSAGYVPVTNKFYSSDVDEYIYDIAYGKKVFEGMGLEYEILISNSENDVKIAELVKNDLEDVGIKVSIKAVDGKIRDENIFDEDYDLAIVGNGGWGRTPDYLRTLYSDKSKFSVKNPHGMGAIGYSNEKITELAEKQLLELDIDKRENIFKQLQVEISKEIPIIVLGNQSSKVMFRKDHYVDWVKTFDYQQLEQNRMSYVK